MLYHELIRVIESCQANYTPVIEQGIDASGNRYSRLRLASSSGASCLHMLAARDRQVLVVAMEDILPDTELCRDHLPEHDRDFTSQS